MGLRKLKLEIRLLGIGLWWFFSRGSRQGWVLIINRLNYFVIMSEVMKVDFFRKRVSTSKSLFTLGFHPIEDTICGSIVREFLGRRLECIDELDNWTNHLQAHQCPEQSFLLKDVIFIFSFSSLVSIAPYRNSNAVSTPLLRNDSTYIFPSALYRSI